MKITDFIVLLSLLAFSGCSSEECDLRHTDSLLGAPAVKKGTFPESGLNLKVGDTYQYVPVVSSPGDVYYQWYLGEDDMGTEPRFTFNAVRPTRSKITLELTNDYGKVVLENRIIVPGADYTGGCLIINEGWFGHEPGSVSYYNFAANTLESWAYKNQNFGATLGNTAQSATVWNGKLYISSKQGNQLTVVDPKTLYVEKSIGNILPVQAYEFVGLNEEYGILTASGDIFRVNLTTFETEKITTGNTWKGCGSAIVYQGKLLLNVNGQKLYVMEMEHLLGDLTQYAWPNSFPYTTLDVLTNGGCRFVKGKDGNVYTVESTGSVNNLVKIKPDWSLEKKPMRGDYVPSAFGSYREDSFCGTGEVFFYIAGGKIYKATFAQAAPETPFTDWHKEGYILYGAGIRVNPATEEVMATYVYGNQYEKNLLVRFDGKTGEPVAELMYEGYYFPGTIIFN